MKLKLQFAGWLMALGMCAALVVPCFAQGPRANGAQNRQDNKPPKQQSQAPRQQQPRQEQWQQRQQQQEARRAQNERQNSGGNRPPNSGTNRRETATRPNNNPNRPDANLRSNNNANRPPSAYTPPPAKKFESLPRQEQQKILQSNKNFERLTPAQRQEIKRRAEVWGRLTSEQQNHLKNDVFPKWKALPDNRRQAIQNRLNVLQNMPESARNQHLNDPNFTRGMSEEDKATLRDLSHLHVGAPDPPSE